VRRFYKVGCSKVKLEQEGEVSCGKVCEEGLPKVTLKQEGEESWEGSAKKVAEGSDASRKNVARVGLNWRLRLLLGSDSMLEAARVFLKTRQTRYVDGQGSK